DGSGKRIDFTLNGGEGTVTQSELFAEPLRIAALEAKGAVTNDFTTLELESSKIDFHGPVLKANGSLTRKEQSVAIALDATAEELPVEELYRYWPVPLAAKPREWVTTRITKGIVPHAHAKLVLDTADIVERHIPADALAAEVDVEGATIRYLDSLPPAENAKGTARFTGKGMDIAVSSASMYTEAKLKSGRVQIPDMTTPTPEMLIDLSILAPGEEVAQYLDNELFSYTKMLNLAPETTSGIAEGDIKLRFSLNHDVRLAEGVTYNIKATLKEAKAQKFMESMDIDKGDFILAISRGKAIDLEGTASINTLPVGVVWHTDLSKNEKFQQSYRFKAKGDMSQFGGFGLPPIEGASGTMTMDATIQQSGGTRYIDATIDLTQMALDLPKWQYSKALGETGALTVKGTGSTDNSLNIQNFTLAMPEAEASGTALIASKPFAFEMLNLNRFRMGKQDISLRLMEGSHNDYDVTITGSSLDLGQMLEEKDKEKKSAMPDMNITLDVAQLFLGGNKVLPNVEGTLTCKNDKCATIDTTVTFDNGRKAVYKVSPGEAGTRKVSLTSEDAGKLVGALNITDKLFGGVLDLNGTIADSGAERTVAGRVLLTNCRLIKAPVLAKILALSSLSGIAAALEGDEGVFFKKMTIPYTMKGNVFSFKDALASGPSVGVSANGAVNIDTTQLDINGTLIPSNVLNTLVGKVPLVGETIVGGEGEGLFATSFKVEGTYEDAKVSANPLSMLTPGLLRNVFGDEVGDVTGEKKPSPESKP
ncbi:MAG: AsmA-like C-terminal domain-containing protein, partial [Alphaproteobacteria bacterium]|nr:AsmA-like C-terminal domain-containing protein [Alphaproteobacteria bacterium]